MSLKVKHEPTLQFCLESGCFEQIYLHTFSRRYSQDSSGGLQHTKILYWVLNRWWPHTLNCAVRFCRCTQKTASRTFLTLPLPITHPLLMQHILIKYIFQTITNKGTLAKRSTPGNASEAVTPRCPPSWGGHSIQAHELRKKFVLQHMQPALWSAVFLCMEYWTFYKTISTVAEIGSLCGEVRYRKKDDPINFMFPPGIVQAPAFQWPLSHLSASLDGVVTSTAHEYSDSPPSRHVVGLHFLSLFSKADFALWLAFADGMWREAICVASLFLLWKHMLRWGLSSLGSLTEYIGQSPHCYLISVTSMSEE